MASGFRGVGAGQDVRFTDKDKKLLKSMKFPKEYEEKVNLKPVNWEAIKGWVAKRATELLGVEDEVLVAYIFEQIDRKLHIDPRMLQISLTGFLEKNASLFVKELWGLLASASQNPSGVPQRLLDEKAEELRKKKETQDRINENLAKEHRRREEEDKEERKREEAHRRVRREQREATEREEAERRRAARDRELQEREKARDKARRDADRERDRRDVRDRDRDHKDRDRGRDYDRDRRDREPRRESARDLPLPPLPHKGRSDSSRGSPSDALLSREPDGIVPIRHPKRSRSASPDPAAARAADPALARPVEDAVEDKPLDEGPKKEKKAKKDKKEKKDKKAKKAKKKARAEAKQGSSGDSSSGDEAARQKESQTIDELRQLALKSLTKV